MLLDKNFEHIESHALHTLTSITRDFILEIGKEVKANTEGQGRSDANLCDMMNTAHDYSMSQQELVDHMQSKELTLAPMQQHLSKQMTTMQKQANSKLKFIQSSQKETLDEFRTQQSIPGAFAEVKINPLSV